MARGYRHGGVSGETIAKEIILYDKTDTATYNPLWNPYSPATFSIDTGSAKGASKQAYTSTVNTYDVSKYKFFKVTAAIHGGIPYNSNTVHRITLEDTNGNVVKTVYERNSSLDFTTSINEVVDISDVKTSVIVKIFMSAYHGTSDYTANAYMYVNTMKFSNE